MATTPLILLLPTTTATLWLLLITIVVHVTATPSATVDAPWTRGESGADADLASITWEQFLQSEATNATTSSSNKVIIQGAGNSDTPVLVDNALFLFSFQNDHAIETVYRPVGSGVVCR